MASELVKKFPSMFSFGNVMASFVDQTTTHGIRKISVTGHPVRRLFWVVVFFSSLAVCCYHCSHLITLYMSSPKMTITEEKDATEVEFPSLAVCNLNIIKRGYAETYFENARRKRNRPKNNVSTCFQSEWDLLSQSAVDLSDTWMNLGITRDNLSRFGHKVEDLVVQCTYNSKDCFSNNTLFKIMIRNVTSPVYGLCHSINIHNLRGKPIKLKKAGVSLGLRLTLNIEKDDYWDLISPEYGVRLLVHPQRTYPTLERGGIIAGPGTMIHIGVKRRVSKRLPGRHNTCTETFLDSGLYKELKNKNLDFDLQSVKYTYEHCNILCRNTMLLQECDCLDDQPRDVNGKSFGKFCNPCNKTQAACRSGVLRNFSNNDYNCDNLCKPACTGISYDVRQSKSDWPNVLHQLYVMRRAPQQWEKVQQLSGFSNLMSSEEDTLINTSYFKENLLRVHLYMREMSYASIEEEFNYKLPKLLADLGGCLGLYLGVSVISIIEVIELFGSIWVICLLKTKVHRKVKSPMFRPAKRKRHKRQLTDGSYGYPPYYRDRQKRSDKRELDFSQDSRWGKTPVAFSDHYYGYDRPPGRQEVIRRF